MSQQTTIDATAEAELRAARPGIGRWIAQPLVCVVGVVAVFVYINTKTISKKEVALLNNGTLVDSTFKHLYLTAIAAILVIVIAVPLGVLLTRGVMRRYSGAVMAVSGFGQAAPAVGLVVLGALIFGIGDVPFIGALTVYGILPVLANVVSGLDSVDPKLVEAGRGMGMSAFATLRAVELPIAVPIMLAGVRTALVLMCGTAAFGGLVGAGGLGAYLNSGIKLGEKPMLIVGAVMIAMLALLLDWIARVVEVVATPKGL